MGTHYYSVSEKIGSISIKMKKMTLSARVIDKYYLAEKIGATFLFADYM